LKTSLDSHSHSRSFFFLLSHPFSILLAFLTSSTNTLHHRRFPCLRAPFNDTPHSHSPSPASRRDQTIRTHAPKPPPSDIAVVGTGQRETKINPSRHCTAFNKTQRPTVNNTFQGALPPCLATALELRSTYPARTHQHGRPVVPCGCGIEDRRIRNTEVLRSHVVVSSIV